jgi:single-stranded DNA-binding protein
MTGLWAMAAGTLARDPEQCSSAKGKTFVVATVRVGSGDKATFVNVIAFNEAAERLLQLRKGIAVSVAGRLELKTWTSKDGGERSGLSVVASEIAAARPCPRVRDAAPRRARSTPRPSFSSDPLPDDPVGDLYVERE